ncbi:MAG: hypothetical protein KDC54_22310 [Lewinella sp.]|nr:hypothetical protein [Lewinella sp.]
MNDILDHHDNDEQKRNDQLTKHPKEKSAVYLLLMIVGGVEYMKFIARYETTFFNLFYGAIVIMLTTLLIGTGLVLIRYHFKRRKAARSGKELVQDPIWFQIIENGFVWWLFWMVFVVVGAYL